jgi:sporulation related protein
MADRYQNRPFPAEHNHGGGSPSRASAPAESDPLAELARLIGQTDPLGTMGRANLQVQPRQRQPDPYQPYDRDEPYGEAETDAGLPPGPPSWMQRANRQEVPSPQQQDYSSMVHPLHRYTSSHQAAEVDQGYDQPYVDPDQEADLSRYDDALYGESDTGAPSEPHDQAYADEAYDYQDDYSEDEAEPKRRGRMAIVFSVLALAVFGVGGAYAYRTYMGSGRTGEPPIIRADAAPTKIIPAPSDAGTKVPDRMVSGDGNEKIVPREEVPVDVNARSGPRVVFPPINQSVSPPSTASVTPGATPSTGNGTLSNNEPRKIKTLSVRGDQSDAAATPVAPPATPLTAAKPAARTAAPATRAASSANASAANPGGGPLSLAPQGQPAAAEPPVQTAAASPTQNVPSQPATANGGYLVQVSSQRNEADAQASYKALQGKFPSVLGSRSPLIKRADLGDKGVYYRAMVGPFNSSEEASQFCGSLKSAGGQCVIQRN